MQLQFAKPDTYANSEAVVSKYARNMLVNFKMSHFSRECAALENHNRIQGIRSPYTKDLKLLQCQPKVMTLSSVSIAKAVSRKYRHCPLFYSVYYLSR